jgi:phosphoribosylamine--glycine ligase
MAEKHNRLNVLVVGAGGREHALVWKLRQSRRVDRLFCAPGNPGMANLAKCVNIKAENIRGLTDFALRNKINLTVVGPELPLAYGIVDEFQKRKLPVFGPDRKAAQVESSKVFAKEFMQKYHIPTAPFRVYSNMADAMGFCKTCEFPIVIKADGLAAGKGVVIAHDREEAWQAIENIIDKKIFGPAGARIVIEACLTGPEVSLMAITDGKTILPLLPSQDHKRALDGDKGPNTGGMGAYCPAPFLTPELLAEAQEHVLDPTITGLRAEGITYRGILYAGLMLTSGGLKVLEFNCRFGDPETQVVLPMMKSDLAELCLAVAEKKLGNFGPIEWRGGAAACVVMASRGYPGKYTAGQRINGLQNGWPANMFVFHSGTKREGNTWLTSGGRVLCAMGVDNDLKTALDRAYSLVGKIRFDGAYFRRDIGARALQHNGSA